MFTFLLIVLILDGLLLTAVVLMQAGQGGGLASMGGSASTDNSLIGGRQAATLLTKMSWITGGVFLGLALLLSVISSRDNTRRSVIDREQFRQNAAPTTPAPNSGSPAALPGTNPTTPAPANNTAPATTTTGQ